LVKKHFLLLGHILTAKETFKSYLPFLKNDLYIMKQNCGQLKNIFKYLRHFLQEIKYLNI